MSRYLTIFLTTFFLAGYAGSANAAEKQAYIYKIKPGTTFVLKKDLTIPERAAHVDLQDGKIKNYSAVDKYAPNCRFEVNTKGEQTIKPATFTVAKVKQSNEVVTRGTINYAVKFELKASDPNIRSITCGAWGSTTDGYVTVSQMQQAVGDYFDTPTP